MQPEDTRLTEIDNVFLLRKATRLPFEKRNVLAEVKPQHRDFPISAEVIENLLTKFKSSLMQLGITLTKH
jgi:hypothetical protein